MTSSLAFLASKSQELLSLSVKKTFTIGDMNIGLWVKAARKSAGWTQTKLGDAVGRTKANVGHWETGKHEPSFDQIVAISRATGFPLPTDSSSQGSVLNVPIGVIKGHSEVSPLPTYRDRLQQAMHFTNKSCEDVASATGIFVERLECNLNNKNYTGCFLSAEESALVAKYLGVDANWLALGDGPMRAATDNLSSLSHDAVDIARSFDRLTNKIDRELAYSAAIGIFMKMLSDRTVLQKSNDPVEEANPEPIQSDPVGKLHA